jgi:hypothetical protein
MLLLVGLISIVCAAFFYCQALVSGLGRKRWAFAGLIFGPLIWPMFSMKRRMIINKLFGLDYLIFKA